MNVAYFVHCLVQTQVSILLVYFNQLKLYLRF